MQSRFDTRGLFFAGAISDPAALTAMSATGGQRSSLDPGSLDSQLIAKAGNAKEDRHALIQAWGRPLVDAVLDELAAHGFDRQAVVSAVLRDLHNARTTARATAVFDVASIIVC